ncbi:MAG: zf-HC2 domain-containing protein [Candidatus Omnitrophica bacterium]|jgi:hypothetical protein|nr:zf-HC2 domain-containing protein [Candidatus Omnitrophota bacterium]
MDCEEIKRIIPRYFQHTASEEEIKKVEEHLCVCHDCRTTLGELMDKLSESEPSETPKEDKEPTFEQPAPDNISKAEEIPSSPVQEASLKEDKELEPLPPEEEKVEYFPAGNGMNLEKEPSLPEEKNLKEDETVKAKDDLDLPKDQPYQPKENVEEDKKEEIISKNEETTPDIPVIEQESLSDSVLDKKEAWHLQNDEKVKEAPREDSHFPLDRQPLEKKQVSLISYLALAIGIIIFLFFIYLRIKG